LFRHRAGCHQAWPVAKGILARDLGTDKSKQTFQAVEVGEDPAYVGVFLSEADEPVAVGWVLSVVADKSAETHGSSLPEP
jgi:hypothetical protein